MKVKGFVSRSAEGLDFVPAGISKITPMVLDSVKEIMIMYGVSRFDVGFLPFGSVTTYVPKVADIKNLPPRPAVLDQAIREVFKNLAPVIFMHGIMVVELTDFTDEELKNITKLWQEVTNA